MLKSDDTDDHNNNHRRTKKTLHSIADDISDARNDLTDVIKHNDVTFSIVADKLQSIEHNIRQIHADMRSSKNGSMLWKISNFTDLVEQCSENHMLSISSDFVYTGIYGYKLEFRLYPYGLGVGEGTHLSLYVILHKTEHDLMLHWPFQQKVKVKLLNMNEAASKRNHHIVTLGPDRNSSSFVRPIHGQNPGFGFPTFLSHQDLQRETYLRENCLFIKLLVEPYDALDVFKQSYD